MQNTNYSKRVKKRLVDMGQTQVWLMEQVREKTGLYVDSSYLSKIFTGKEPGERIVTAINEILGIKG